MEPKRLYRSNTDRKVGGVAGGLGEYFRMDTLLIRLIFVILTLAGGGGVLIYIVLWIVTPENPAIFSQATNPPTPEPPTPESGTPAQDPGQPVNESPVVAASAPQTKERKKGSLVGGLILITIGTLFLADEIFPAVNFGDLWPLILVAIGAGLLINVFAGRKNSKNNQEI